MVAINLFSLTHQSTSLFGTQGNTGTTKAKSTLNFAVKRDTSTSSATSAANATGSSSHSSRVEDKYEQISEANGVSNMELLKTLGAKDDTKTFQNYIERFTISDRGDLKTLKEYDVEGIANTIAAKYASLSYQIENGDYSAEEKQTMQKRLDEQLEDGLGTLSERFNLSASDLFTDLGFTESDEKNVAQSLSEIVKQYKDEFTSFLNSDEGKAFLEQAQAENPDTDLMTSDVALTDALLYNKAQRLVDEEKAAEDEAKVQAAKDAAKAANGQAVDSTTKTEEDEESESSSLNPNLFTLEDLSSFADLQSTFNTFLKDNLNTSEEEMGYQMGLTYVKSQEILKEYGVSDNLAKKFESGFDDFVESTIKDFNTRLEDKQETAEETSSSADPNSYKKLDESTIKQSMNAVINYYNATGSAMDAMVSGFEFAQSSFMTNQANNSSVVRYQVGSQFFNNFYNAQKGSGKANSADMYSIGMSYYKRYATAMQN